MYVTQEAFIRKFCVEFFSRFLKISTKTDASTDRPTSPNPFEEYVHFYLKMCTCLYVLIHICTHMDVCMCVQIVACPSSIMWRIISLSLSPGVVRVTATQDP